MGARWIVLAACAALVAAGPFKLARPDGTKAKLATHADEKRQRAAKKAEAEERKKMTPEERKAELKEKLGMFDSGEGRTKMYMKMARTKKLGMPEAEFQKQQQMYGKLAVNEAQLAAKARAKGASEDAAEAAFRARRDKALGRAGLKRSKAESMFDADDAAVVAPPKRRFALAAPSPRATKVLGRAGLLAATVAAAKVAMNKVADARAAAPRPPAPAAAEAAAAPAAEAVAVDGDGGAAPAPANATAAAADGEADGEAEGDADDADADADADGDDGEAEDPVAAALGYPGMSAEAAARLDETKARAALLGRIEGQYKLRGETVPLSVQNQTSAELEATLAALRDGAAPAAGAL